MLGTGLRQACREQEVFMGKAKGRAGTGAEALERSVGASAEQGLERGRFSSRRKLEGVLRVPRGETVDAVSRDLGVTAGRLARWRDEVLAGAQAALKRRPADERDEEIRRLRA
jgi:transposase